MNTKSDPVPSNTIAIQGWLRPALTPVLGNRDYDRFAEELKEIDALIRNSALEGMAVEFALEGLDAGATDRQRRGKAQFALFALRSEILRHLIGAPGFVAYSSTLASSELLSDFCGCRSVAIYPEVWFQRNETGRVCVFGGLGLSSTAYEKENHLAQPKESQNSRQESPLSPLQSSSP